ncbi:hypothetical protein R1sor_012660 [Riccia sorocarpa]|uniref:Uncharacterized protein n=1 Tax=Riccia sorocarpa TaxID=122646 RepID=A0ABD3IAL2_9MARC
MFDGEFFWVLGVFFWVLDRAPRERLRLRGVPRSPVRTIPRKAAKRSSRELDLAALLGAAEQVRAGFRSPAQGRSNCGPEQAPCRAPRPCAGTARGSAAPCIAAKPAVQPPPKPAAPETRTKVKAPRRVKKERTESMEVVDDAEVVVEKERSSEGPWLIKRYFKEDVISKVQWAYMKPEDISGAFAWISEFHQRRLGLRGVITRQYVPPNVPLCKEWLLSFDGRPKGDCSATVQGQRIVLSEEMFRDAFFVEEELNPRASQEPFPKHVIRSGLEDWPRSIAGPIIHFVKSALEPILEDDSDDEGPHPQLLDLPGYQFKCVKDEMCQVKKHLEVPNNTRLRETFVDQVLTHLLIHLGIYKGRARPLRSGPRPQATRAREQGLAALRRAAMAPRGPLPGLLVQRRGRWPSAGLAALRRGRWPSAGSCGPAQGREDPGGPAQGLQGPRGLVAEPQPLAALLWAASLQRL